MRSSVAGVREIKRNTGGRGYRHKQAHKKAQSQAKRGGPRRFTDQVRADAENPLNYEIQSVRGKIEHVKKLNPEHGFQLEYLADRYLPKTGTGGAKPRSDEIAPCYNNSTRQRRCRTLDNFLMTTNNKTTCS